MGFRERGRKLTNWCYSFSWQMRAKWCNSWRKCEGLFLCLTVNSLSLIRWPASLNCPWIFCFCSTFVCHLDRIQRSPVSLTFAYLWIIAKHPQRKHIPRKSHLKSSSLPPTKAIGVTLSQVTVGSWTEHLERAAFRQCLLPLSPLNEV